MILFNASSNGNFRCDLNMPIFSTPLNPRGCPQFIVIKKESPIYSDEKGDEIDFAKEDLILVPLSLI